MHMIICQYPYSANSQCAVHHYFSWVSQSCRISLSVLPTQCHQAPDPPRKMGTSPCSSYSSCISFSPHAHWFPQTRVPAYIDRTADASSCTNLADARCISAGKWLLCRTGTWWQQDKCSTNDSSGLDPRTFDSSSRIGPKAITTNLAIIALHCLAITRGFRRGLALGRSKLVAESYSLCLIDFFATFYCCYSFCCCCFAHCWDSQTNRVISMMAAWTPGCMQAIPTLPCCSFG